ncbi:protein-disulfide isomerase [Saccharothrix saharensis]|uniref:Protein-disulfide isomerase n=1 Tax=Saccharothrix saharensis TaxID=571190 RepID=A0A543JDG5_9PSEU|nr:thioredoxin domain-containing protein [Saccharothrix saharensis]TQM80889.1 protein-disulfide isomerase [Saccharothrix saharensis]
MGGAERNARKKKQQQRATKAVVAARGTSSDRNKVIVGVVVVVVLAAAVIGGVLWSSKSDSDDSLANPPAVTGISAPIVREGGAVVVGEASAKVTLDLYEDFLCPACGSFKKAYGEQFKQEIEAGNLRVRYHALPFLIRLSDPEGYSRDSANAALCAADAGKFWEYHEALFARQPEEGGPGHTKDELVKLGTDLGITGDAFKQCVDSGAHEQDAQAELDAVKATGKFKGTPTVMKDGEIVSWDDRDWLTNLLK